MLGWNTPNALIAGLLILFAIAVFLLVLLKGLGGEQAVFLILGYVGGWVSSIVLFFYRKSPPKNNGG